MNFASGIIHDAIKALKNLHLDRPSVFLGGRREQSVVDLADEEPKFLLDQTSCMKSKSTSTITLNLDA